MFWNAWDEINISKVIYDKANVRLRLCNDRSIVGSSNNGTKRNGME